MQNAAQMPAQSWIPPLSFEEKLKAHIVPPGLFIRYLFRREQVKGEREIDFVRFLASKDRVSIDASANKGVYSYALLPHSAAVHAFEPNPKLCGMLRSWAEERGVAVHQKAVSAENGTTTLFVPRFDGGYSNQGASLRETPGARQHGHVEVETLRLDDAGIDNVGFIKIDVEGCELEVLKGARGILERDRPNLLVEIEEVHHDRRLPEMIAEVCGYGYDCFALVRGTLTPFAQIDLARHHVRGAPKGDYVFNFIFLPR